MKVKKFSFVWISRNLVFFFCQRKCMKKFYKLIYFCEKKIWKKFRRYMWRKFFIFILFFYSPNMEKNLKFSCHYIFSFYNFFFICTIFMPTKMILGGHENNIMGMVGCSRVTCSSGFEFNGLVCRSLVKLVWLSGCVFK